MQLCPALVGTNSNYNGRRAPRMCALDYEANYGIRTHDLSLTERVLYQLS